MDDTIDFHTSVKKGTKQTYLLRGTIFAGLTTWLLVWVGVFLPPASLAVWGLFIFLFWILSLYFFMNPYRRLSLLENTPDTLRIHTDKLVFYKKGQGAAAIPFDAIETISYQDNHRVYGIGLKLKGPTLQKISVHGNGKLI